MLFWLIKRSSNVIEQLVKNQIAIKKKLKLLKHLYVSVYKVNRQNIDDQMSIQYRSFPITLTKKSQNLILKIRVYVFIYLFFKKNAWLNFCQRRPNIDWLKNSTQYNIVGALTWLTLHIVLTKRSITFNILWKRAINSTSDRSPVNAQ